VRGAPAAAAQAPEVVAEGLSNPRGMSFGPGGHLYVAESGRGGSGRCLRSGDGQTQCYGATGAIARIDVDTGRTTRIVRRLPSLAAQEGEQAGGGATGPNDISFRGRTGYFTVGLAADPRQRDRLGPAGRRFATLYRLRRGEVSRVVDLGAYEARANPDAGQPGAGIDTNPCGVDATGPRLLVTDAGGNTLLRVRARRVSTLAVLPFGQAAPPRNIPNIPPGTMLPVQPVPTGLTRGADGAVLVGTLTGFPFPAGGANVFRREAHPADGSGGVARRRRLRRQPAAPRRATGRSSASPRADRDGPSGSHGRRAPHGARPSARPGTSGACARPGARWPRARRTTRSGPGGRPAAA